MNWEEHAGRLAQAVTEPGSRWRAPIASVPRHEFAPRWWERRDGAWHLADGPSGESAWLAAAYSDQTLVTRAGALHADRAVPGARTGGRATSSSTHPSLVVTMYRHAAIGDGMDVLDIGTGSGYGAALLSARLGPGHVTTVDVDPYIVKAAAERLDGIGLRPAARTLDATGPLPGTYDRIVSMTSVAPVPASWLAALRPGGRLVTVITGTAVLVTADKQPDGTARGRASCQRATFMEARPGNADYPPELLDLVPGARDGDGPGARESRGLYPLLNTGRGWDVYSMLGVTCPGIGHYWEPRDDGQACWLVHPDGSWAMATDAGGGPPRVRQGGPRRLWDLADQVRGAWLAEGSIPVYGACVTIGPDGGVRFENGGWHAEIPAGEPARAGAVARLLPAPSGDRLR